MTGQENIPSVCFCGNAIDGGIVCSECEIRLPVHALQKMYNLVIGALITEKCEATPHAEHLKELIKNIYMENLNRAETPGIQITKNRRNKHKNPAASALGRMAAEKAGFKGMSEKGKKGSRSRAEKLTPERRSEIARQAALAKHKKYSEKKLAGDNKGKSKKGE